VSVFLSVLAESFPYFCTSVLPRYDMTNSLPKEPWISVGL